MRDKLSRSVVGLIGFVSVTAGLALAHPSSSQATVLPPRMSKHVSQMEDGTEIPPDMTLAEAKRIKLDVRQRQNKVSLVRTGGVPIRSKLKPRHSSSAKALLVGPYYRYTGAEETGLTATGLYTSALVNKPYVNTSAEAHSLGEIAAISANGQDIIEAGYTSNCALTGGACNPHLFVSRWVGGSWGGYDGWSGYSGGWVDYAPNTTYGAASNLFSRIGTAFVFQIEATATAWWVKAGPTGSQDWIGYYPKTLWTGASPSITFDDFDQADVFWEIVSNTDSTHCGDMGNGYLPSGASPAYFNAVQRQVSGSWASASMTAYNGEDGIGSVAPTTHYNSSVSGSNVTGGGPGYASSGSGVGTRGSC